MGEICIYKYIYTYFSCSGVFEHVLHSKGSHSLFQIPAEKGNVWSSSWNWWVWRELGAHLPGVRQDAFGLASGQVFQSPTMMASRCKNELSKMHHPNDPFCVMNFNSHGCCSWWYYRIKTSNWFIDSFIFMFAWKCLFQSFPLKAPKNNFKTQSPVRVFAWCCTSSAHQPRCNAFTSNILALAATRRKACDHEEVLDNAWSTLEVKMPYRRTRILHWEKHIVFTTPIIQHFFAWCHIEVRQ